MAAKRKAPERTPATRKATKCPVTREEFLEHSKPLAVKVGESTVVAGIKEFSSGSYGWFTNEKIHVDIGGTPCKVQMNLQLVLIGSKPQAEEDAASNGITTTEE